MATAKNGKRLHATSFSLPFVNLTESEVAAITRVALSTLRSLVATR